MSRIVIDSAMEQQLRSLAEPVEFVDAKGTLVGFFNPANVKGPEPTISPEEFQRRLDKGGGRKLADIMADLEKLP